jgi:hypothetical protein
LVCYPYLLCASTCFLFLCFCHMSFIVFALCLWIPCSISLWYI